VSPTVAALPPLPDDPRVSVVIPARHAAASLPATLRSVLTQSRPPDEVVVAVAAGDSATAAAARRLAGGAGSAVHVVDNPTGRTPEALNQALAVCTGQVVARVDAHAVLPPHYLADALETLRRTGAGNVGAVQYPVAEAGFARAVATAMRSPLGSGGATYRGGADAPRPVDTAYLGVFRREALDAVGGYDPTLTRNQDAELNLRLAAAGYPVWLDPRLVVAYHPRGSVAALARQFLGYGRWRRRTVALHPGSLRPRQLVPVAVVGALGLGAAASLSARDARPVALLGGGYLGVLVGAALSATRRLSQVPAVAAALGTMHLSWGVGFLLGPPRTRR
jgi:succinoglycan biosynthesis protein ExoA